jgi:hypothetical protein
MSKEKKKESAYQKRKREMNEILESDAWKNFMIKSWEEYRRVNSPANRTDI